MEQKMKIRDLRKKEKFIVDDEYLNGYARIAGYKATLAYMSLCRHASKDQSCFPSITRIAEQHGLSRPTIIKGIKELEKLRIIKVVKKKDLKTKRQQNNVYILLDKSQWVNKAESTTFTQSRVKTGSDPSKPQNKSRVNDVDCKETHIKETHIKDDFSKEKSSLSKLKYTKPPKEKYKSKYKIAEQKKITLKRTPRSKKQDKTIKALKWLDYYRDKGYELHGMQFFKVKDDNRNKVVRKLITRIKDEVELKALIDWWLDGAGEWAGYEPEVCFSTKAVERFLNKDKTKKTPKVYKF